MVEMWRELKLRGWGEVIRWASSRTENGIPEKRVKMISFRVSLAIV